MMSRSCTVVLCSTLAAIVLLLVLFSPCAAFVKDGDPQTIGWALAQPDNSTASLVDLQTLWRGRSGASIAVKEWSDKYTSTPRLLLVSKFQLPANPWWSINVKGTLATLEGTDREGKPIKQRVLVVNPSSDVTVFCDWKTGRPYPCVNKNFADKYNLWMRPLSDFATDAEKAAVSAELPVPLDEPEPPAQLTMLTLTSGTISWAKSFADTTTFSDALNDKIVSRAFPGLGYFYIQEADRSSGIRVNDSTNASYVLPGDLVSIPAQTATITTVDGERVINSSQTTVGSMMTAPRELCLIHRELGGGSLNSYTPGPAGGAGLNNVGLLTKVCGKVTSIGTDYFYLDDGSAKTDGSGATGVRVVNVIGYMPAVNDYVALTGISGLATYATDYARTVRLADPQDFSAILPLSPPAGLMVLATGSGKITLYWEGVPGATGYNIYRGTTSGGENYSSPVNGGTPVNEKSYPEGNFYWFTNTGLTNGQEYFYTVKAVANGVESQPSDEGSDIPDASAIPWDTADAYAITSAARSVAGYGVVDLVRVVGPDRRVYDSIEGTLPPDGEFIDDETIQLRSGTVVALSKDVDPDQDDLEPTPVNPTDGPIRRVRSNGGFNGVKGDFRAIDRSTLNKAHPKDHIYMYLGSHKKVGKTVYECDAGLQWSTLHGGAYNPYLSMNKKGPKERKYKVSGKWVLIDPSDKKQFGAQSSLTIHTEWVLNRIGQTKNSTGNLYLSGLDWNAEPLEVLYVAPYPFPVTTMMKRCHSIAQGGLKDAGKKNGVLATGSFARQQAFYNGYLRTGSSWGLWTATDTFDQGSYPLSTVWVGWNTQIPYSKEESIYVNATSNYP